LLYSVSLLLLVSGAVWAWINHLDQTSQASERMRDFKPWLLKLHGLSAMLFVLLLGTLLPGHVRRAWRAGKNRRSGAFFLTVTAVLTLSGYLLYYTGDEAWRNAMSNFHLWLGLAASVLLLWHIRSGRRAVSAPSPHFPKGTRLS
jgi:heme/copper-type cytochrome/quinol oxidase subunit 3